MLEGVIRESITKANAKALKKDGYLIANVYGKGIENVHCVFKLNPFIKYLKEKKHLIFPVKLGDKTFEVVVQEYQKNPVTNELIHVDLLAVTKGVKSKFKVPVKHQGTPVGLKNKGILMLSKKRISVECAPEHLPDHYLVDVAPLDVNESILVRDLEKHENVKILDHDSIAVIGVIKAK